MPGAPGHAHQIRDLPVRTKLLCLGRDLDALGEGRGQAGRRPECGIFRLVNTENDLDRCCIIQGTEGAQPFIKVRLVAAKRLQDRHRLDARGQWRVASLEGERHQGRSEHVEAAERRQTEEKDGHHFAGHDGRDPGGANRRSSSARVRNTSARLRRRQSSRKARRLWASMSRLMRMFSPKRCSGDHIVAGAVWRIGWKP